MARQDDEYVYVYECGRPQPVRHIKVPREPKPMEHALQVLRASLRRRDRRGRFTGRTSDPSGGIALAERPSIWDVLRFWS